MNLAQTLKPLIQGDVYDDAKSLDLASRDASLFEVLPKLVVAPKNAADIGIVLKFAEEQGLSITARSGGTDMSGGPLTQGIVLDMKPYFNHILEVSDGYAITEPGVYYRDFDKATLKKGQIMPSYPASREICTVGGMVANNSGGEKSLTYGKTERYVEELSVVLSDGNEYVVKPLTKKELEAKIAQKDFEGQLYKKLWNLIEKNYDLITAAKPNVTKNSAGYYLWNVWDGKQFDLCKLLVGSQGTLGITTKIRFKLIRPKKHSRMLVIFLKDLAPLTELVAEVLKMKPESFESYDDHTLKLAVRFFPDMARSLGTGFISLAISFIPEALTVLRMGGLPKMILMAEFTSDSAKECEAAAKTTQATLKAFKLPTLVTRSEGDGKKYWLIRRESFNLLRHHVKDKHTAPFIDDVVVTPAALPQFLPELNEIMAHYSIIYTIAGHVGDANFHIIPLMDLADPETKKIIPKLSREVYDLVLRYKGSITGEHNDGLIRTPFLLDMYGPKVYKLFEETKLIFDPKNLFNPGKKVHANLKYALDHFIDDSHAS